MDTADAHIQQEPVGEQTPARLRRGNLEVDLTDLALPGGGTTAVAATVGTGELTVRVPGDAAVVLAGLLFTAAAILFAADIHLTWDMPPRLLWPVLLIAWGTALVMRATTLSRDAIEPYEPADRAGDAERGVMT